MAQINEAPVDLFIKMHGALVAKNYNTALSYCNTILAYEQHNVTMRTFQELLTKKLEIMDEDTDSTDTSSNSITTSSESDIETTNL